jgi:hypothetical protein
MSAVLNEEQQEVSQLTPNLPFGLQRTVDRCVEKKWSSAFNPPRTWRSLWMPFRPRPTRWARLRPPRRDRCGRLKHNHETFNLALKLKLRTTVGLQTHHNRARAHLNGRLVGS